jgi:uncharacterized protein YecE (DUF72 family)
MDFGRVEYSGLDSIDFKLPKEPYTNSKVLPNQVNRHPKFYVGLAKWGRKEFIGKIYPRGTKERDFVIEYSKNYNAIEFNATHYKLYKPEDILKWKDLVSGKEFKICPKVYQGISHYGSFDDKQFLSDVFLQSMRVFGDHLGPIFLQVSDKFGPKRKEELFKYLETLPKDLQFFLEVRHPDWFTLPAMDELIYKLQKLKIGFVITDTARRRDVVHMNLTIPKAMIRFIGNDLHETDFKRLDDWVTRIKYWVDGGLQEVYFFIHCLNEAFAPELSQYLIKQLNAECGAGLDEIKFIS